MIHITMGGSTMVLIAVLQTEAFCVVPQMVVCHMTAKLIVFQRVTEALISCRLVV